MEMVNSGPGTAPGTALAPAYYAQNFAYYALSCAQKLPIMLNIMLININDATVATSIQFTG